MIKHENAYKIAVKLIPGIGDVTVRKLVAYCKSLEAIFHEKKSNLVKIPGISDVLASNIIQATSDTILWKRVEEELAFCEKYNIQIISFTDKEYPYRLAQCDDTPVTIFAIGKVNLNPPKALSIVGTRRATNYGKTFCQTLIKDLHEIDKNIAIVSGLAYGIDITAHKYAIEYNLPTIAVLAHGLDIIYPSEHKKYVKKMIANGGLITEFLSKTKPDKPNFVKRNRIIAAFSDATLVVESQKDGGAMITANLAFEYNRDVLALPGRIFDTFSEGPNFLIKSNKASLVENCFDVCKALGWETNTSSQKNSAEVIPIIFNLTEDEQKIINILKEEGDLTIDLLAIKANLPVSKVSVVLLNLEFNDIVETLPGKIYTLRRKI
ncbi:MAG: DNA-processing protein DprA [Bacteroidales bacterium]|nr:DNA-processing protein DprA [Bacteroidales bacterium]